MPGVSRLGATIAAARLRGFAPAEAQALATAVGMPVIAGAVALKGVRVVQEKPPLAPLAAGAAAAFASTLAAAPLARAAGGRLWPWAAYRCALAVALLWQDARR